MTSAAQLDPGAPQDPVAVAQPSKSPIFTEITTAVRHTAVYGLGSVVAKALGFLMVPFYTRHLSPLDYGALEILDLSMSLLGMLLNMGMTTALLRSYAIAGTRTEKHQVVSTSFLFAVLTGILTFGAGVSLVAPVSGMLLGPKVPSSYLLMAFASFVLGYIANLPRTYLRALEASGAFIMVDTVALFLMLLMNIFFIAALKMGVVGILLSSLIAAVLQVVVLSVWTIKKVGVSFNRGILKQMMGFGLPLIFSNLALFTLNFADRFFLKHFQSLDVVGVYAVGYKFAFMLNYLVHQPFFVMWQGRMYEIHKQPDYPAIYGQIFMLYSALLLFCGLGLAIFSPEIVHFMVDPRFAASAGVIPVVSLAYVFCGIGYFNQLGMFLVNRTKVIGALSFAAACVNLALNYILIRQYGMMGAAWATLLSFAFTAVADFVFSQRALRLPLAAGRAILALGVALTIYIIAIAFDPKNVLVAIPFKIALLVAFGLILWITRILSTAEIGTLLSMKNHALALIKKRAGSSRATAAAV